jgi:hypothetical protein
MIKFGRNWCFDLRMSLQDLLLTAREIEIVKSLLRAPGLA